MLLEAYQTGLYAKPIFARSTSITLKRIRSRTTKPGSRLSETHHERGARPHGTGE